MKTLFIALLIIFMNCLNLSCVSPERVRDAIIYRWTLGGIHSDNAETRIKAAYATVKLSEYKLLPEEQIPEMIEIARTDDDVEVRYAFARNLGVISSRDATPELLNYFLEVVDDDDVRLRIVAVDALGDYDDTSTEALTALLNALNDPKFAVRIIAARNLPYGPKYADKKVPVCIEALGYPQHRDRAILCLLFTGESARDAVPHLLGFLKNEPLNEYPEDRIFTIRQPQNGFIDIPEDELLDFLETNMPDSLLLEEIKDMHADRIEAHIGYGLGINLYLHGDERIHWHARTWEICREEAAFSVLMIDSSPEVIQVIIDALKEAEIDQNFDLMRGIFSGLFAAGEDAAPAVDILIHLLQHIECDYLFQDIVLALSAIGLGAKPAIPILEDMLVKHEKGIDVDNLPSADQISYAIASIESDLFQDLKALVILLNHQNSNVRSSTTHMLRYFKPPAYEALPKLRELAEHDPDEEVRDKARQVMEEIENTQGFF